MKKILIIATGGTIACSDSGDGLKPSYDVNDLLSYINYYRKKGNMINENTFSAALFLSQLIKELEK